MAFSLPSTTQAAPSYSLGERILRTIYYEMSVAQYGFLERLLLALYKFFAKGICCSPILDQNRETQGLRSFQALGAQIDFVVPRDGLASIQMMHLSAADVEKRIEKLGGSWKKMAIQGSPNTILAITPPIIITSEWFSLEESLLRFKWPKQDVTLADGTIKTVIITCDNADVIDETHTRLFLHANSAGVTFNMLTRRWGFYLGCKQNICAYNPRGAAASKGIASEGGHYNDIQAVYEKIKGHYPAEHIWLSSACGGGPAAAYLKSHNPEIKHWIFENGFTNLQACIDLQSGLARSLARGWMGGLRSRDIPDSLKPQETGYNLAAHFEHVSQTPGTIVVVKVANDQVLTPAIYESNLALARRVHDTALSVSFTSVRADGNHHIARYYNDKRAAAQIREIIFHT